MKRWRVAFAALLVGSSMMFAGGVTVERSHHHEAGTEASPHVESGGEAAGSEAGHVEGPAAVKQAPRSESAERVLGVNPESWPLVVLVIGTSVLLAAAILLLQDKRLLVVAIVFVTVATAFDVVELVHQLKIGDATVGFVAGLVALAHAASIFAGVAHWRMIDPGTRLGSADTAGA